MTWSEENVTTPLRGVQKSKELESKGLQGYKSVVALYCVANQVFHTCGNLCFQIKNR